MKKTTKSYNRELTPEDVYVDLRPSRVHHNNCTWCKYRRINMGKHEIETCFLTGKAIPLPFVGDRYCDQYKQIGCECEKCKT